jgi:hypothetical protein
VSHETVSLKVPKCENFHRTDFFDFFTIKYLWVGDFRAKIKNKKILIFRGSFGGFFFENFVLAQAVLTVFLAQAQPA